LFNVGVYDYNARAAFGCAAHSPTRMATIFNSPVVNLDFLGDLREEEYVETGDGESEDEIDKQLAILGIF
jgi:hypothetical protein